MVLAACQAGMLELPTRAPRATLPPTQPSEPAEAGVPSTWTPDPVSLVTAAGGTPAATWTSRPTAGPLPSLTPIPTFTPTSSPTPSATATESPTVPATANLPPITGEGPNRLPNPSFEEGWYHIDDIPELQVPNGWRLEWDEGHNPLDPDPWNQFVRPESRVLPGEFLPVRERSIFIWDGQYTVKIFKGQGALSYRLLTDVYLDPGSYVLETNIYPDLVLTYTADGGKIFATDRLAGEVQLLAAGGSSGWQLPRFGQKNTYTYAFAVPDGGVVTVGIAIRGRWAITNNGWFMDDWSLRQLSG
jgi:hypothetical protein